MRAKLSVMLAGLVAVVVLGAATPEPVHAQKGKDGKDGKDGKGKDGKGESVVGAMWAYNVTKAGTEIESGKFRAHDFKIYKGAIHVGNYVQTGNENFKLTITQGKLEGTINLTLIKLKPQPKYGGDFTMKDGTKARIHVTFLKS